MSSRYHTEVDPLAPNNSHAFALRMVGDNRRVLELGAASGHVTRVLAGRGCSVTAVELEPDAAAALVGIADEIIVGDLEDESLLHGLAPEYDVVLAGDVLEHLRRPDAVLARISRLLRPGGSIVVSLPNVAHADVRLMLLHGRWQYGPWGLLDTTHVRFFTLQSINEMLERSGFVMTDLMRVRVPAFETELSIDRSHVSTAVLDVVLSDPEAETYQFVFTAVPHTGEHELARLARRNLELHAELELAHARAVDAESRLEAVTHVPAGAQRAIRVARRLRHALRRLTR